MAVGKPVDYDYDWDFLNPEPLNAPLTPILHEDNHLLVVVKPPTIPVQKDRSGDPDLLSLLKADLKRRHQKPGNVFLGLVHRLDRPVGGVMVFAKTSKAAARLSEQIRSRTFEKTYLARVRGCPEPREHTLRDYLVKDNRINVTRIAQPGEPGAKEAVLTYCVEKSDKKTSLVRIQLQTGRPHQIRAQMANIGCPLVGDRKYGCGKADKEDRPIALWSYEVGFKHPTRDEIMHFRREPDPTTQGRGAFW